MGELLAPEGGKELTERQGNALAEMGHCSRNDALDHEEERRESAGGSEEARQVSFGSSRSEEEGGADALGAATFTKQGQNSRWWSNQTSTTSCEQCRTSSFLSNLVRLLRSPQNLAHAIFRRGNVAPTKMH